MATAGGVQLGWSVIGAGLVQLTVRGFVTLQDVAAVAMPGEIRDGLSTREGYALVIDMEGTVGFEPGMPVAMARRLRQSVVRPHAVVVTARLPTIRSVVPALGVITPGICFEVAETRPAAVVAARAHLSAAASSGRPTVAPPEQSGFGLVRAVVPAAVRRKKSA